MSVEFREAPISSDSIVFAGDYVRSSYFDPVPVHPTLSDQLRSAHASIVNFEAPVDTGTPAPKHGATLGHSSGEPEVLSAIGFDHVTLANNHIMDHGDKGLTATRQHLKKQGIETVGAGSDLIDAIEPIEITISGTEICIFSACEKEFGIADEETPGAAWIRDPQFKRAISEADSKHDLVFVVAHGGIEYVPLPPPSWRRQLRSLVDSGADLVLGHHPHVPLPWELYDGTPILYSLGNFAFYNEHRPETRWTYLVEVEVSDREISELGLHLVETTDGRVQQMATCDRSRRKQHLTELAELLSKSASEPGYWQDIAVRTFEDRYRGRLEDYGSGHLFSTVKNPVYEGDRITRGALSHGEVKKIQQLAMLNYIQSDCHRDVIETALEVKTGVYTDRRTDEIEKTVGKYYERVNTLYGWSRSEHIRRYLAKALNRIDPRK